MSLKTLPRVNAFQKPKGYSPDAEGPALDLWSQDPTAHGPAAAAVTDGNVIEINDVIGEDWWTGGGFTSNRMSAALRSIGPKDITVMINSPGGDVFEGLAMFNMLAEHPAKVTVQVMGLAASAASIIAMAGDSVLMAQGAMMMIHNAWGAVVGNRHDLQAGIDIFAKIDAAMADIYAAKTGLQARDIAKMMDGTGRNADGTWLTATDAVNAHFADGLTQDGAPSARAAADTALMAKRRLDALLAQQGLPRSERRSLLRESRGDPGMPSAVGVADPVVMPGADEASDPSQAAPSQDAMAAFLKTLTGAA